MVSVMLYPGIFCIVLSMDMFVLCVAFLTVFFKLLGETIRIFWVWWLIICC